MFEKLDAVVDKYNELTEIVADPDVISNQSVWQKHMKEMGEMEPIVKKYIEYKEAREALEFAKELVENESDEELRDMAKLEVSEQEENIETISSELRVLLVPKDPNDERNVILEIRAGTGGDEAALFGADLFFSYLSISCIFTLFSIASPLSRSEPTSLFISSSLSVIPRLIWV